MEQLTNRRTEAVRIIIHGLVKGLLFLDLEGVYFVTTLLLLFYSFFFF